MGYPAGDMGRPAMNPAPRNPMPARPANLRVMIISAQARPRPSPYKPRPAVQYISCHPYTRYTILTISSVKAHFGYALPQFTENIEYTLTS
ncbi:hypothetical protein YC2023_072913 [Brassica napus]